MQNREHLSRLLPTIESDHHQLALETEGIEQGLQIASRVRGAAALLLVLLGSAYWTSCISCWLTPPTLSVSMLSCTRIPELALRAETVKTTTSRVGVKLRLVVEPRVFRTISTTFVRFRSILIWILRVF